MIRFKATTIGIHLSVLHVCPLLPDAPALLGEGKVFVVGGTVEVQGGSQGETSESEEQEIPHLKIVL